MVAVLQGCSMMLTLKMLDRVKSTPFVQLRIRAEVSAMPPRVIVIEVVSTVKKAVPDVM